MNCRVTYTIELDVDNKAQAATKLAKEIAKNGIQLKNLEVAPICPYNFEENQKRGTCGEMCEYRENGICTLDKLK